MLGKECTSETQLLRVDYVPLSKQLLSCVVSAFIVDASHMQNVQLSNAYHVNFELG